MDYISNSNPPISIEKPFSKTHAPVYGIGVLEKFKGIYSNSFKNYCSKCPNYSYIFH